MQSTKVTNKPLIRVTEQANEHVDKIVQHLRARGLSVSKTSFVSELIMLCPIEDATPAQRNRKRARVRRDDGDGISWKQ